jgi:hypothetical protein
MLLHAGTPAEVLPGHIGVMATYRKQVRKVRLLLRQRGLGEVRVGTVDDYQVGGEAEGPASCCLLLSSCCDRLRGCIQLQPLHQLPAVVLSCMIHVTCCACS